MENITWTITFTWDYDPKRIAEDAEMIMDRKEISYDCALSEAIEDAICGEDDYIYYNFTEEQFNEVAERVKKMYPLHKQLTLF